jgi:6-phosphogluconolactonase
VQTTIDNRFAVVADLGIDRLLLYPFDARTGMLKTDSLRSRSLDPGAGPRHIAVDPAGKYIFVVNELSSTVTSFSYDGASGTVLKGRSVSTRPDGSGGENTTAEILVDARGRFLYVSNRGDDTIVVYAIDPGDGRLSPVQWVSSGGRIPRNIALDPSGRWLFVANQRSNTIVLFGVDPGSGRLTPASRSINVVSPVCVSFFPVP